MNHKIRAFLPHVVILICNMYLVFFAIDIVNTAMNFIDNGLTKGLLLIFLICAVLIAWPVAAQGLTFGRVTQERRTAPRRGRPAPGRRPAPRGRGQTTPRNYSAQSPRRGAPDGQRGGRYI